jgi:hypothetical protein
MVSENVINASPKNTVQIMNDTQLLPFTKSLDANNTVMIMEVITENTPYAMKKLSPYAVVLKLMIFRDSFIFVSFSTTA